MLQQVGSTGDVHGLADCEGVGAGSDIFQRPSSACLDADDRHCEADDDIDDQPADYGVHDQISQVIGRVVRPLIRNIPNKAIPAVEVTRKILPLKFNASKVLLPAPLVIKVATLLNEPT